MKQWYILIVAVLFSGIAEAQLRPISGFVINESKQPISDAVVKDLDSTENIAVTDSFGRFSLITSSKQLEISHISYKNAYW